MFEIVENVKHEISEDMRKKVVVTCPEAVIIFGKEVDLLIYNMLYDVKMNLL